jgi:flagellar biosynthesis/type III secretory pathway M-ring protein FliF/YscJ
VGADERRGDLVTVESVPFLEPEVAPPDPATVSPIPPRFRKYVPFAVAGAALVAALVLLIAVRRALKRSRAAAAVAAAAAAESVKALVIAPPEEPEPIHIEKLDPEELRTRAHDRAADDPATAALVLRFWLGEGNVSHEPDKSDGTRLA